MDAANRLWIFLTYLVNLAGWGEFYCLSVKETLEKPEAKTELLNFFDNGSDGARKWINIFDLCAKLIQQTEALTENDVNELREFGLKYQLERELMSIIDKSQIEKEDHFLKHVQNDCCLEIQGSIEYKDYLAEIEKHL